MNCKRGSYSTFAIAVTVLDNFQQAMVKRKNTAFIPVSFLCYLARPERLFRCLFSAATAFQLLFGFSLGSRISVVLSLQRAPWFYVKRTSVLGCLLRYYSNCNYPAFLVVARLACLCSHGAAWVGDRKWSVSVGVGLKCSLSIKVVIFLCIVRVCNYIVGFLETA